MIEQLRRPTALVCSSKGAERVNVTGGRKRRDDALLDLVKDTIQNGGTVLIPTDSSARTLELAYILEKQWREELSNADADLFKNAKVYLASRSASATLRYTRSMIEWMDEGISQEMEAAIGRDKNKFKDGEGKGKPGDQTPFNFHHIKLLERKSKVEQALSSGKPSVILASDKSLEWGFSREVIKKLSGDARNLVILTENITQPVESRKGIGRYLWELWERQSGSATGVEGTNPVDASGAEVPYEEIQTVRLEGDETLYYQQYLARRRQMHSDVQGDNTLTKETAAETADDRSSTTDTSEDTDDEHQGRALNISATMTHARRKVGLTDEELGVNVLIRRKNIYDYDVRGKRGREKVFPFVAKRNRNDDFGDVIRPEEYLRAEERDDVDGEDMRNEQQAETAVGQKRKWDEVAPRGGQNGRHSKGPGKRAKTNDQDDPPKKVSAADGDVAMNGDDAPAFSESEEESDYEPEDTVPEGPLKAIFTKASLRANLRVAYVDFSGLHEKRDLQMLIPLIRPRKLILVAGEQKETLALAEDCKLLLASDEGNAPDVFAPVVGETVNASVDTNAWTLKLSRSLVKKLTWQNVKGLGVVAITGRLEAILQETADDSGNEENQRKKLKLIKRENDDQQSAADDARRNHVEIEPVLDVLSTNSVASSQLVSQPLHVGDLRLADLRRLMQASGHTAEFRGEGTLLIDGMVVVRKSGTGKIEVEGGGYTMPGVKVNKYEGSFFAVRRKIYEGLAVVAGG